MPKEIKTNVMRILEQHKVPAVFYTYECKEFTDGLAAAKAIGADPERTYKTLVTAGKPRCYYVFVLPVTEELDLKKAARAAGEKSLEMIPVRDITAVTGYVRGGCSPIGMKKAYPVFVDESCLLWDTVFISGGRVGSHVELPPKDLLTVCGGKTADLTAEA